MKGIEMCFPRWSWLNWGLEIHFTQLCFHHLLPAALEGASQELRHAKFYVNNTNGRWIHEIHEDIFPPFIQRSCKILVTQNLPHFCCYEWHDTNKSSIHSCTFLDFIIALKCTEYIIILFSFSFFFLTSLPDT